MVSQYPENVWRLYNIHTDRSELNDLSNGYPDKVKAMEVMYENWAKKVGVVAFDKLSRPK